jgi:hypothetical protein
MARRKTVKKIIEEAMPGMEPVPTAPRSKAADSTTRQAAAAPGPSIAQLRQKYFGAAGDDVRERAASGADEGADDEVEVHQVRSKTAAADPVDQLGARTVIVSKKRGKIIGAQG